MSDVFDDASVIEQAHREQAIARQRAQAQGPDVRNVDCADCGDTIDPARRAAVRNCRRCIDCERTHAARLKYLQR